MVERTYRSRPPSSAVLLSSVTHGQPWSENINKIPEVNNFWVLNCIQLSVTWWKLAASHLGDEPPHCPACPHCICSPPISHLVARAQHIDNQRLSFLSLWAVRLETWICQKSWVLLVRRWRLWTQEKDTEAGKSCRKKKSSRNECQFYCDTSQGKRHSHGAWQVT